ncbi:hypothetical protein [Pseudomonas atacamensis]|uniref:hypothetical protein n=1 Tax=Pseudomonas atacamensis TaxID=2565368 RepID=UPI002B1CFC70|nr:hypothetical protein [Pseudomonas atacamensis]
MTAKTNSLPDPKFSQAVNGVLKLSEINDPTKAVVPAYTGSAAGDVITLNLRTTHGEPWATTSKLTNLTAGNPVPLDVPKSALAKGVAVGDRAYLKYEVTKQSGNVGSSAEIDVGLEP